MEYYSDRRTCEMITLNEIRYNPAASSFMLVVGLALKSPHTHSMLLRIESTITVYNVKKSRLQFIVWNGRVKC